MAQLLVKETNFEIMWGRIAPQEKERMLTTLQHVYDALYASRRIDRQVKIDIQEARSNPVMALDLFEGIQRNVDHLGVVSSTSVSRIGSSHTLGLYAGALEEWAKTIDRKTEEKEARIRTARITREAERIAGGAPTAREEAESMQEVIELLKGAETTQELVDEGVAHVRLDLGGRTLTFEIREQQGKDIIGHYYVGRSDGWQTVKEVYEKYPESIRVIGEGGKVEPIRWSALLERLGSHAEERAPLVTTVARYKTEEEAIEGFLKTLSRNAAGMPRVEGNYLVFDLEQDRRVRIEIREGMSGIKLALATRAETREEKIEKSRRVIELLRRGMDVASADMVLGSVYYLDGRNVYRLIDTDSAGFYERDTTGLSGASRLALSLDFFLDPKARKWYGDKEHLAKATTIARDVFGTNVTTTAPHEAYLATIAAQAQLDMKERRQDGLAGDITLTALEKRKEKVA